MTTGEDSKMNKTKHPGRIYTSAVFFGSGHVRALCRTSWPQLLHFLFFRSCWDSSLLLLIRLPQPVFLLMSGFCTATSLLSGGEMNLSALWGTSLFDCGPVVSQNGLFIVFKSAKIVSNFSSSSPAMLIKFLNSNQARLRLSLLLSLLFSDASTWVEPRNECSCSAFFVHLGLRNWRGMVFTEHWCNAANECLQR